MARRQINPRLGISCSIEFIRSGRLRAAVAAATRSPATPDVHPSANSYTAMRRGAVHGVGAPRDTRRSPNPPSRRFADMGATALAGSPSDFAK